MTRERGRDKTCDESERETGSLKRERVTEWGEGLCFVWKSDPGQNDAVAI